jgi:hypothetical protein
MIKPHHLPEEVLFILVGQEQNHLKFILHIKLLTTLSFGEWEWRGKIVERRQHSLFTFNISVFDSFYNKIVNTKAFDRNPIKLFINNKQGIALFYAIENWILRSKEPSPTSLALNLQ